MNNTIVLESCLKEFKIKNEITELSDPHAFELFSLLQITKDWDLSFSEIEDSIVDGGNDGGIDSVILLIDDTYIADIEQLDEIEITKNTRVTLYISQCKFEKSFKETALDKIYISIPILFNLSLDETELLKRFNSKLVEKIIIFRKVWLKIASKSSIPNIIFSYICKANTKEKNTSFELKINQVKEVTKEAVKGVNVDFLLYSSAELIELFQKPKKFERILCFKENPIPVQFKNSEYGYIGVVLLKEYFKFITDDNKRIVESIFESNVRHYQGSVDVNKKIQETLENEYDRDFWWLNNGVTIICSECVQMPKMLSLSNVQIVNGLQTSFTVGKYYDDSKPDERSILVKIIISKDKETIDKVISATNSQTPVSAAILRATDDIQRNIELYFLGQGYYYDRRKNYYKNLGKPAKKIFSIQGTAQAVEAILNKNPSSARSTPTKLIKNKKIYERIFIKNMDFKVYLNCCLIYQKVKEYIHSYLDSSKKNDAKNFLYHISRVVTSFILSMDNYTVNDIIPVDPLSIESKIIRQAYDFIIETLSDYQEKNPNENIINIAKSKKFTDELNKKISERFAQFLSKGR